MIAFERNDGTRQEIQEGRRQHQLTFGAGDEIGQRLVVKAGEHSRVNVLRDLHSDSRLQVDPQDTPIWQGKTRHHRWQHPAPTKE